MSIDTKRQLLIICCTLIAISGIYIINAGHTALNTAGTVADIAEDVNYTLPPGYTFSIWGLIYLGFILFAIYQALPSQKENPRFRSVGYWVAVSLLCNLLWTVMVGLGWYLSAYLLQWLMLILSLVILRRWKTTSGKNEGAEKLLIIPFSLYAGWLTVAMIPFSTELLQGTGWEGNPFTPESWGIIMYIAAAVIIFFAYRRIHSAWYILPLAWALGTIALKFEGTVAIVAAAVAAVVLLFFMMRLFKSSEVSVT